MNIMWKDRGGQALEETGLDCLRRWGQMWWRRKETLLKAPCQWAEKPPRLGNGVPVVVPRTVADPRRIRVVRAQWGEPEGCG